MKKFFAFLLTFAMLFSLAAPAMAATITGDSNTDDPAEGNVSGTYHPIIEITGISITGDTVTYDPETNTYTTVFPVGAESITYSAVYSGKNLAYYRDDADNIWIRDTIFRDGIEAERHQFALADYNNFLYEEATGNLTRVSKPSTTAIGLTAVYEYSTDGGQTWHEACKQIFVQAYSVSIAEVNPTNADVTVDKAEAIEGETVTVTAVAHDGYRLNYVTVYTDSSGFSAEKGEGNTYTFTMPDGDVIIRLEVEKIHAVNIDENIVNGSVTSTVKEAIGREMVGLLVTADPGYKLDTLTVTNDTTHGTVWVYEDHTFDMPNSSVTVTATFVATTETYTVTIGEVIGGTVTLDKDTYAEGDSVVLTLSPDEGYVLRSMAYTDSEGNVHNIENNTFIMPASDVTVNAELYKPAVITGLSLIVDDTEYTTGTAIANPNSKIELVVHGTDLNNAKDYNGLGYYWIFAGIFGQKFDELSWTYNDDNTTATKTLYASNYSIGRDYEMKYRNPSDSDYVCPGLYLQIKDTTVPTYQVIAQYSGAGTITVSTQNATSNESITAAKGETVTITATPWEGYVIAELTVTDANGDPIEINENNQFVMPASDVTVGVVFLMPGTELDTIYFKNTEGWETITVKFYDSRNKLIGSTVMTLVGGETDIYSTTKIPEWTTKVSFTNDSDETEIVDLPTNGTNQYNYDDSTWTEFTATVQPVTSAEIVWGSMAFTYTDGSGWANNDSSEDAGTVTVKNTGTTTFSAQPIYTAEADYDEINGYFYDSADAELNNTMGVLLDSEASHTFWLRLSGKPNAAIEAGTKIGTVTIHITEGNVN